ncbi:hypothetical protein Drorol1_Dr00018197 [Drosera rotundifolia]
MIRPLVDDADNSIFGAIYEFEPKTSQLSKSGKGSPRYVIAFRGTLTKSDTIARDLELDLHLIRNELHESSRVENALQAVRDTVAGSQGSNVWLTGHSLGAALAILSGKNMAMIGRFLESFLFNPPFFSVPIEQIKDQNVKHGIRIACSVITAGLALAVSAKRPQQQKNHSPDAFAAPSMWVPNIFVHPADHLCAEYIGYFEHTEKMEQLRIEGITRLAAQHSLGGLLEQHLGWRPKQLCTSFLPLVCLSIGLLLLILSELMASISGGGWILTCGPVFT